MCHLIYPASTPWHKNSETQLILYDGTGTEAAQKTIQIPCGGSIIGAILRHSTQTNVAVPVRGPML